MLYLTAEYRIILQILPHLCIKNTFELRLKQDCSVYFNSNVVPVFRINILGPIRPLRLFSGDELKTHLYIKRQTLLSVLSEQHQFSSPLSSWECFTALMIEKPPFMASASKLPEEAA